jgi:pilus assembly protein CpaD
MTRYPFTVDSRLVTQAVIFQTDAVTLDEAEKIRVNAFLAHFMQSGGGVLEIRSTAATDDGRADARLRALQKHVLKKGARPYEIRLRKVAGGKTDNGPIILSFESFTAKTFKCIRRNARTAANPTNRQHPDFGCSLRGGIAAMISNPADLERPRARQPSDATRRSTVIGNYRAGQPTESIRGTKEQTTSIRELGG